MKYIVNIIIFIVLWTIIAAILMGGGVGVGLWHGNVTRPSSWPAVSGIIAIIFAYRLVKKINKSKFWIKSNDSNVTESKTINKKLNNHNLHNKYKIYNTLLIVSLSLAVLIPIIGRIWNFYYWQDDYYFTFNFFNSFINLCLWLY